MQVDTQRPMTLGEIALEYGVNLDALRASNPALAPTDRVNSFVAPEGFERSSLADAALQAKAVRDHGDHLLGVGATPTSPAAGGFIQRRVQQEFRAMDAAAASKALLQQHTTPKPSMSLAEAMQRLEPHAGTKIDGAQVASDGDLQDAVVAMLAYRFTPVQPGALDDVDDDRAMDVATALLPHLDDAHRDRFSDEVLFNFAHPVAYQAIWPGLMELFPPEQMEAAILDRARSDNELHINNALSLPYYIFGRSAAYPLSVQGRARLRQVIADLEDRGGINPLLQQALAEVRLPVNL